MNKDDLLELVEGEKYFGALDLLEEFVNNSSDEEYERFIQDMYDPEAEYRDLSVSYDDKSFTNLVYYGDEAVGEIDNHMSEMSFRSYLTPLGRRFPYTVLAPKRSYEQYPDDEVSVAEYECFDRYVRSGEPFRYREGNYWDYSSGMGRYIKDCRRRLDEMIRFDHYEPKG